MTYKRYAVYFAPPAGDFADRAAEWLGWDAVTGQAVAQPALGLSAFAITSEPRRYGFHATIKPPFRLAEGESEAGLKEGLARLCQHIAPLTLAGLQLQNIDGFLGLVPEGDDQALQDLAAQVVRELEPFRASLTPAEILRRRPERLNPRQRELLDLYGYPYVMEEFRFHMTLTDRLELGQAGRAAQILAAYFAPVLPRPFVIASLCLFGEAAQDGQFHLLHRYALSG